MASLYLPILISLFRIFQQLCWCKQIIDVIHPKRANVPKKEVRETLAKQFKVKDDKTVFVFGFKTAFGGQKSTGFATLYDSFADALDTEPKYRLVRSGQGKKKEGSRKSRKDVKNKRLRLFGTAKDKGKKKRKSADADE